MRKLFTIIAACIAISACASTGSSGQKTMMEATKENAMAAIAAAKAANERAASVDHEWRDTGKIIKSAEEAAGEEDFATAIKLAHKAEEQGKDAYAQWESESDRKVKFP